MPPPQKPAVPTTGPTAALNAVTGDPFLDGIIQNRLSHMSSTAQGFVDTANTIADTAVGFTFVGGLYEVTTGETFFGGRPLSLPERALSGVGVIVPGARIAGNVVDAAGTVKGMANAPQLKIAKPGTAKERSTDVPSWVEGQRPCVGENGNAFAKRLLDDKYGPGNWKTGSNTEHSQIKKYGDRGFMDPPPTVKK